MTKLIVGLGNPGTYYSRTRHNAGFLCVNHFARSQGIRLSQKQGKARTGTGEIAGEKIIVARPQTAMNLSGLPVGQLMRMFKLNPEDIIVIHDELDLPLGKIRLGRGSRAGGHKGVKSIIHQLQSQDFIRIRVGIGRPDNLDEASGDKEERVIEYVLGEFTPEEKAAIMKVIPRVTEVILCLLTEGLTAAMNRFN